MASESIITLYDSASASGKPLAWNCIVAKARYALNFKGIPHKTVWLDYPDIDPTMRSIGATPTSTGPDGQPWYTLPVIIDPSRRTSNGGPTVVSDSWAIVEYLDDAYPSPGLLLPKGTKAMQMLFQEHITDTFYISTLAPILVPLVVPYLNEASRPYWRQTRERFLGGKLEEFCPKGTPKWDEAWGNVRKRLADTAALLDKNGSEGTTLVMGTKVTFVDFQMVSFLDTISIMVPEEWEKIKEWDGGRWKKLRDYCEPWRVVY